MSTTTVDIAKIWELLENVKDPEIPVLSVIDLGVIRDVQFVGNNLKVVITPTYSGCPAMDTIEADIKGLLRSEGFEEPEVELVLSPAWTTDWMTESGKKKLLEYGIAPPVGKTTDKRALLGKESAVKCPRCGSEQTEMISFFGSTACKSHYRCNDCLEPFDYFKCL